MKVLLLSTYFEGQGGAEFAVHQLALDLIAQNHQVKVVCLNKLMDGSIHGEYEGVPIIEISPFNLYWAGENENKPLPLKILWQLLDIFNFSAYKILQTIIQKEKPDIIHVHKMRGFSPSVWLAAKHQDVPVIQTCHDYELMSPVANFEGKLGRLFLSKNVISRLYTFSRSWLSDCVSAVTSPSNYTCEKILGAGFFGRTPIKVTIPNSHGYSSTELKARRGIAIKKDETKLKLMFIGRLETIKGIENLCESFASLTNKYPNVVLDIVGTGSLYQTLQEKYAKITRMKFHGKLVGEAKEKAFEVANMVLVPSKWPEVFGIVIIEAFAHGIPVIATNEGGMKELIQPGKTGYYFKGTSTQSISETLIEVLENTDNIIDMKNNCFDEAEYYSNEAVLKQYLNVYERVINDYKIS
ncbi:MAG: hypothetical protein AUK35_03850 [Zetaproteobacteria bacterium CG2_30_46_52]|nr:MAG: hypothetical protein AUK35_03850 [Zetaproteobacteria bacterium CG2_30_46_52]